MLSGLGEGAAQAWAGGGPGPLLGGDMIVEYWCQPPDRLFTASPTPLHPGPLLASRHGPRRGAEWAVGLTVRGMGVSPCSELPRQNPAWGLKQEIHFCPRCLGPLSPGAGTLIPSAQRLVWAAKQPLGKAALGALFA